MKNTDFYHRSRLNILDIHLKKVNILYLLHDVISLPDAMSYDKMFINIWEEVLAVSTGLNLNGKSAHIKIGPVMFK